MSTPVNRWFRLLRWLVREEYIDEIEGDLMELYYLRAKGNQRKARRKLAMDALRSLHPIHLKPVAYVNFRTAMYKNYFKTGFRNLRKDWSFSMLNVLGLSVSLAVFLTMILFVKHEFSYDQFHQKGDRIFQVIQEFRTPDGTDPETWTSMKLADALESSLPYVEKAVTVHNAAASWTEVNGKRFFETNGIVASTDFFDLFDFEVEEGNKSELLVRKRSIVLTRQLADKYFDFDNPIGNEIEIERYGRFVITGVLADLPSNSMLQFDFIITQDYDVFYAKVAPWFPNYFQSWSGDPAATFVMLSSADAKDRFTEDANEILAKHLEQNEQNPHYLIKLYDLHFGLNGVDGRVGNYLKGDRQQVNLFIVVAFVILTLACFNYINISTARSINRSKEVGIRKSIGAFANQVRAQFLVESLLLVMISVCVSIGIMALSLPYFSAVTSIPIDLNLETGLQMLPYIVAVILVVSILAGFYPALVMSRVKPVLILKNISFSPKGNNAFRGVLVTLQFLMVIVMISVLVVVKGQYDYMSSKPIGFDKEHLLIMEINGPGVRTNYRIIKDELEKDSRVLGVTGVTRMISGYRGATSLWSSVNASDPNKLSTKYYGGDSDIASVLKLNLIAGDGFSGNPSTDSTRVLINEVMAESYGGLSAVGKWIHLDDADGEIQRVQVAGVVKDFHRESLHDPIDAVAIGHINNVFQSIDDIVIRIEPSDISGVLAYVESVHNQFDKDGIVTIEFLDDMMQRAYEKEMIFRDVFIGAAFISLLIALLGTSGLIAYSVLARSKELSIRRVLGANDIAVYFVHARPFVKYTLLAGLIGVPLSWWLSSLWLNEYAYRINLNFLYFLFSCVLVVFLVFSTVFLIGRRSMLVNPASILRSE